MVTFPKILFRKFFRKKFFVGHPPAAMGGHFQIDLWPKLEILKLSYNKNSQNWNHFLWSKQELRTYNFIISNHFLQNSAPLRSFWIPQIAKNLKIWQYWAVLGSFDPLTYTISQILSLIMVESDETLILSPFSTL